ncbi:hypothetical protein CDCA_CDCA03G0892 [Cyanidium caldarium]|uniref:Protein kinase domain-containing protein n=1 Tax=Cyanidium caldarium TaxID=2771 RepID=A0AAV9IR77_CYACA|nr:hypothetical protein CDCA_CDCA03G0892 [Cyanidium caldarium]
MGVMTDRYHPAFVVPETAPMASRFTVNGTRHALRRCIPWRTAQRLGREPPQSLRRSWERRPRRATALHMTLAEEPSRVRSPWSTSPPPSAAAGATGEAAPSWRLERAGRVLERVRRDLNDEPGDIKARNGTSALVRADATATNPLSPPPPSRRPASSSTVYSFETVSKTAAPAARYDPERLSTMYRARTLEVRTRQVRIATPMFIFLGRVLLDYRAGREQENRKQRAHEFLQIFANLGPAFIKAGQALASRPDLLPPEYLEEMQKLQDRLPPFDNADAFRVIEEELGASVDEIFSRIEPEPVAAASIGQVYKAYLRDGRNTPVAVKVQRLNCEDIISLDIYILRQLSGVISRALNWLRRDINVVSIIDELGKLIFEEIDYLNEARNAERFYELYGNLADVRVPTIYWQFTRRRVLTMSWVDGVRLNSSQLRPEQAQRLVEIMVQCSLRQMLENGFFHADPHGGNLLATPDGKLCWLDFGMVSEVEPAQRYGIIEAVMHMVNRDFESLAKLYVRLGFIPPETDLQPLVEALNRALPDVLGAPVSELNFKNVIDKLGSVMYKFPFRLPPYYTAIIRCLGVLEGLAIQVRRDFKIINNAYPYIASRLLTDPSPELQNALSVLIFKDGRIRWNRLENLLDTASTSEGYDFSIAARQLVEFILSSRGEEIRLNLATDLVNEFDQFLLDLTDYTREWVSGRRPQPRKSMLYVQKALMLSLANSAVARSWRHAQTSPSPALADLLMPYATEARKFAPVVKLLGTSPEGRQLGLEIVISVAERMTLRGIRALFGLSQQEPPDERASSMGVNVRWKRPDSPPS